MIVACLGVFFVFNAKEGFKGKKESTAVGYLKTQIPDKFMGVTSVEKPLGATEEVSRASEKILNVSDYLHREYTLSSGKKFTLYISYWEPGKDHIINAAAHTPDACWVGNGWVCNPNTRRTSDFIGINNVVDKKLKPAIYREYSYSTSLFEKKSYSRYVWYWFLTDGKVYSYTKTNSFPNPFVWMANMLKYMQQDVPEMYFIRIDADFPIDELREDKEFQHMLIYLGNMILFEGVNGRIAYAK